MKLCLFTEFETDWARGEWNRLTAAWSGPCEIVTGVDDADAILVTLVDGSRPYDDTIATLKRHDVWRRHRNRVFVFDTSDQPLGYFPGLYASLRRRWYSSARHRTTCYFQSFNEYIQQQPITPRPSLLFSFQGNATSPVRERLFQLSFDRPDVVVERTEPFWAVIGADSTRPFKARYADTLGAC